MISDAAFKKIVATVREDAGIHLGEAKRQLVVSRLAKRLRLLEIGDYETYHDFCLTDENERRIMINTITTNETSFFREPHHFEFLERSILPGAGKKFRVWSAAASIGAEGYSIAMTLERAFSDRQTEWEVVGTDINTEVIAQAAEGLYPMRFAERMTKEQLKRYCLRGVGPQEGNFLIKDALKKKVRFTTANLMVPLPKDIGTFDVIFLRNVLIYFDHDNKKKMVENVLKHLRPGGCLFIGHSETITGICPAVKAVKPTIYEKKE